LHWVLDVAMAEDINRSRLGHSAANLALMRKFVLNLLRCDKGAQKEASKPGRNVRDGIMITCCTGSA